MEWVNRYLSCQYEDGARGEDDKYDCWGLVRHVRHYELGYRLLASYGHLRNTEPREFTRAYATEAEHLERCDAEHGAIASVLVGRICVHVAVVLKTDNGLQILEINPSRGPRFMPLATWLRDHNTVTYHRDRA